MLRPGGGDRVGRSAANENTPANGNTPWHPSDVHQYSGPGGDAVGVNHLRRHRQWIQRGERGPVTITAPKSDWLAPLDVPEADAMIPTPTAVPEQVDRGRNALLCACNEGGVLAAPDVHAPKGLAVLSGVTDDFVRLAAALATLTSANHSQGSAATIEALRPAEPLLPGVEDPWTGPQIPSTPRLPAALRRIPTHASRTQAPPGTPQVSQDQPRRLLPSVRLRPRRFRQDHC